MTDKEEMIVSPFPTFSFVVPVYIDVEAAWRTMKNIVMAPFNFKDVKREIILVADGRHESLGIAAAGMQEFADSEQQKVTIKHTFTARTNNHGNSQRDEGIKQATNQWVVFADAGTAYPTALFPMVCEALSDFPDTWYLQWDVIQLVDPAPLYGLSRAIDLAPRENGLPYVSSGVSMCVRREDAQSIGWPDTRCSDWAFSSALWDRLFFKDGKEHTNLVDDHVLLLPYALAVAYGNLSTRKVRENPLSYIPKSDADQEWIATGRAGRWAQENDKNQDS